MACLYFQDGPGRHQSLNPTQRREVGSRLCEDPAQRRVHPSTVLFFCRRILNLDPATGRVDKMVIRKQSLHCSRALDKKTALDLARVGHRQGSYYRG